MTATRVGHQKEILLLAGRFPQDQLAERRVQSVQPVPALLRRLLPDRPLYLRPLCAPLTCRPPGLSGIIGCHRRHPLPMNQGLVLLLLELVGV